MRVIVQWKSNDSADTAMHEFEMNHINAVVIKEDSPLYPTDRKSLIERVNALLDQYEPKDARPI